MVRDLEALAARIGKPFSLHAANLAAPVAITFAARHPELVRRMVIRNGAVDNAAWRTGDIEKALDVADQDWEFASSAVESAVAGWRHDETGAILAKMFREAVDPATFQRFRDQSRTWEVTGLLPRIQCPTLVVQGTGQRYLAADAGQRLAAGIPNASMVVAEGIGEGRDAERAIARFLNEDLEAAVPDESLPSGAFRSILFTDLEGHTAMMARLGDANGRAVLREHERRTRSCLRAHSGTEVKTIGDSFMCWFPSAQSALDCSIAIQRAFAGADVAGERLSVRVGINAGEPIADDNDLWGASVIAAERVKSVGRGGQVMVSDVVRQLVAGKGFVFSDAGEHMLKGFEEPVRIWELHWA
jgi:class 3 adenylate cyclase